MERKEQLEKEIQELEKDLFYIDMIDHWTEEDRKSYNETYEKIKELKKELEELGE